MEDNLVFASEQLDNGTCSEALSLEVAITACDPNDEEKTEAADAKAD